MRRYVSVVRFRPWHRVASRHRWIVDDDGARSVAADRHLARVGELVHGDGAAYGDEHAQPMVNLRRGEPDAMVFAHGLDQVVDQSLHRIRLDLRAVERARLRAQDRMPHARDLENRHKRRL